MTEPGTEYQGRPTPLPGYRELNEDEAALVGRWKELEEQVAQLWATTHEFPSADKHDVYEAQTQFKQAFMWAVRSVTKPRDVYTAALVNVMDVAHDG